MSNNVVTMPTPATAAKRRTSSTSSRSVSVAETLQPATEREIAGELQKLKVIFGWYSEDTWKAAASIYMDAWKDIPPDLLRRAVSSYIGEATAETRFPKPGDIRAQIGEALEGRRRQAEAEAEGAWPQWLEDIWGPAPEGPRKRAASVERDRIARYGTEEKAKLKAEEERGIAERTAELTAAYAKRGLDARGRPLPKDKTA
jgi:hypothetical protein